MAQTNPSDDYKSLGNEAFKAGKYEEAVQHYSQAIAVDSGNNVLFSNRSAAYSKLGDHDNAVEDAQKCIELDPKFAKGFFRLGCALEELGKKREALDNLLQAQKLTFLDDAATDKKIAKLKKEIEDEKPPPAKSGYKFSPFNDYNIAAAERRMQADPSSLPPASAWADGLDPKQQYEWFVDCYRMRIDDCYRYSAEYRGLYDPDNDAEQVVAEFFIFCKLAVRNNVVPSPWNWDELLNKAGKLLAYAFEKEDASDKYGGENIFRAALGGRSLRFTAEMVYGYGCMGNLELGEYEADLNEYIEDGYGWKKAMSHQPELFEDVGGVDAWKKVWKKVETELLKQGRSIY